MSGMAKVRHDVCFSENGDDVVRDGIDVLFGECKRGHLGACGTRRALVDTMTCTACNACAKTESTELHAKDISFMTCKKRHKERHKKGLCCLKYKK